MIGLVVLGARLAPKRCATFMSEAVILRWRLSLMTFIITSALFSLGFLGGITGPLTIKVSFLSYWFTSSIWFSHTTLHNSVFKFWDVILQCSYFLSFWLIISCVAFTIERIITLPSSVIWVSSFSMKSIMSMGSSEAEESWLEAVVTSASLAVAVRVGVGSVGGWFCPGSWVEFVCFVDFPVAWFYCFLVFAILVAVDRALRQ